MKICLMGDFSADLDEGYKNTCQYLAAALGRQHTITRLNAKRIYPLDLHNSIRRARPDIIHVIAQPTTGSILVTHLLKLIHRRPRVVISALRADRFFRNNQATIRQRLLLLMARPDLVLDQNPKTLNTFYRLGWSARRLPNGVDLDRFKPVSPAHKRELRGRYGLDPESHVVLHVGHLEPQRNLVSLAGLPARNIQVVIVGSLYNGHHADLIAELRAAGFHVLEGYQPHVEELYALADCYAFPVSPGDSLTMPLSVLEAMATNLPVITTRFAGLADAFPEGPCFRFIDQPQQITETVWRALRSATACATRDMVRPYSWDNIARQLTMHYDGLLKT